MSDCKDADAIRGKLALFDWRGNISLAVQGVTLQAVRSGGCGTAAEGKVQVMMRRSIVRRVQSRCGNLRAFRWWCHVARGFGGFGARSGGAWH